MIEFSCNNCGKRFSMAEEFAGRKGKCKQCGATLTVPAPPPKAADKIVIEVPSVPQQTQPPAIVSPQPPMASPSVPPRSRSSVRSRRLQADLDQVRAAFDGSSLIRVLSADGNPPETYRIQYNVKGLVRGPNGQPVVREQHVVEIQLTREYPRQSPKCKMLTPIFHPNIEPAMICVGDHWTAGERLVDLIVRIGEMITYQAYNIKSPLDGEAAMWADINRVHLPIDKSNLQPSDVS
jgi:ubiquitin-protein ligase/DNA-directed RNA polymerase subunit RPC12/RpoP